MKDKRSQFAVEPAVETLAPEASYLFVYYVFLAVMVTLGMIYL